MDPIELKLSCQEKSENVKNLLRGFFIQQDRLDKLQLAFRNELEAGLKHGLSGSCLQMENTYVPELPNGTEEGTYLALDLGGTNFRVMLMEMKLGKIIREEVAYYTVQEKTRLGPGEELFDFLAECIKDFLGKNIDPDLIAGSLPLGFTFSFPMTQRGLDVGVLVAWTKSFNCPGVVGQDAVKMLNDAIKRVGHLPVKVVAVLNDATGTLVKGAYDDKDCGIGLILGTGCNGAYLESAKNVPHWEGDRHGANEVIIDPEFGAFGDNGCINFLKTEFDRELDKTSLLPGSFTYEKYFAGKYIGELSRLALQKLHDEYLFLPRCEKISFQRDSVSSSDVSDLVTGDKKMIGDFIQNKLLQENPLPDDDDLAVVEYVFKLLSERCALLVSVPISTFIERMAEKEMVSVAVTGSLYKHHPTLKILLEKYIGKLVTGRNFKTFLSDDGSGKGAGLVAAIGARLAGSV